MIQKYAARRKLIIHQAHGVIGVTGDASAVRPYCRIADVPAHGVLTLPTQLVLAAWQHDARSQEAMAAFQRLIANRENVLCDRVALDAVAAGVESLAGADGVVLFDRGLQIVCHEADLVAPAWTENGSALASHEIRVTAAKGAESHPILDGVESFGCEMRPPVGGGTIPNDASILLIGHTDDGEQPLAWVRHRRHGRAFCASLGTSENFDHPEFSQLVLNALDWVIG